VFDGDSCLTLQPFHNQDWCQLSSVNLCKGHIFDEHRCSHELQRQQAYELAAFVGDGSNDLCPSLRLKASDLVFARKGYSLARRLAAADSEKPVAKVVHWETGFDVLEELKSELRKLLIN
jgi:2-hydroxy-3-keto-5-methylthiopentenyl-1-phosphate phosphatase